MLHYLNSSSFEKWLDNFANYLILDLNSIFLRALYYTLLLFRFTILRKMYMHPLLQESFFLLFSWVVFFSFLLKSIISLGYISGWPSNSSRIILVIIYLLKLYSSKREAYKVVWYEDISASLRLSVNSLSSSASLRLSVNFLSSDTDPLQITLVLDSTCFRAHFFSTGNHPRCIFPLLSFHIIRFDQWLLDPAKTIFILNLKYLRLIVSVMFSALPNFQISYANSLT